MMQLCAKIAATCLVVVTTSPGHLGAETIPAPSDDVILTISGDINVKNMEDTLQFDRASLENLDSNLIETSTIWTDKRHQFQGVSLSTLTELLGVTSGTLLATAINDYTVEIPVSDAVPDGPIVAYLMDGAEMSIRDKGPLWVVYPYDSSPDYRTAVIHARSIWQLDRIEVVQ